MENDKEKLLVELDALKETFRNFERMHDRIHSVQETLVNIDEMEEDDKYFYDVQATYITIVKKSREWLDAGSANALSTTWSSPEAIDSQ